MSISNNKFRMSGQNENINQANIVEQVAPTRVDHPRTIISNLQESHLEEILMNKIPSDSTVAVINSLMCALNETESLQKARKVMVNRKAFIQRLYEFKCDGLSLAKIKALKTYLAKPTYKDFEIEATRSMGTIQLSRWVRSLVAYNEQKIDQLKKDNKNIKNPKVHPYNTQTNSPGNRVSKLASRGGLSPES